jgi:BclB C-terminal domain-containing protein
VGLPSFVGFGSSAPGLDVFGTTINLTGTALGPILNFAFTMPRDGTLTSLNAFFSVTTAIGVALGDYQIHAQMFLSQSPTSNVFDALAPTDIALTPTLPGLGITLGDVATGSAAFNIPVSAGDRLLLVFYVEPPALSVAASVIGYASAGLAIT